MAAAILPGRTPRGANRPFTWRLLPCVVALATALTACGKPAVRGKVLPNAKEWTDFTWARVEVRLLRGRLIDRLSELAEKHRRGALPRALERARTSLVVEQETLADEVQQARAALASMNVESTGGEATSPGGCIATTEAQLAAARRDYDELLATVAPRIAALGVVADTPQQAVPELRADVQRKISGERRRLRDEHLRAQLVQQSRTVLAPGFGMDHLCWKGQNKLDVGLQFRGATVLFKGKPLPDAVARQIWGLPRRDEALRIPQVRAADRDVLLPGTEFESCFYSRGAHLAPDVAEAYGLAALSPTRGGDWGVQWRDISLVAAPAADAAPEEAFAGTVLAGQLEEFRAGLEETRLLDAITRSAAAGAVAQAESTLLACHRAIESEEASREVERALRVLEEGQTDDPVAQARLRQILEQDLSAPANLADWTKKALAVLKEGMNARQMSELGQPFEFPSIAPGPYTLLAESKPVGSRDKLWILPIDVEESVERDLVISDARDGTLEKMLADFLLRPQSFAAALSASSGT